MPVVTEEKSRATLLRRLLFAGLMVIAAVSLAVYALTAQKMSLPGSGHALVGGPFTMVNQRGEVVTEKSFAGKPMLLFFGFTFCPDVCPATLQVVAQALDNLGPKGADIQPIFVSVDPARDTPEALAAYVGNFGGRFVGLTGSPDQVAHMAQAYRVFYEKRAIPDRPEDYLMDHTSILYLMGADGKFLAHFSYTTDAAKLAEGIAGALGR